MANQKILIADDESRLRKLVRDYLVRENYDIIEAADGEEALEIFYREPKLDLIILDIMMPRRNGYEVCREIRQTSQVPIMMLTAKGEESDVLQGFDIGADEYITKPFSPRILVARVNAVLRRTSDPNGDNEKIEVAGICIDKSAHVVTVDGKEIPLSVKEFELLSYFVQNEGIALSRETILNNVWNYDYYGDARTIDTHVKKLRSKLGEKGELIKTIWGRGYKLEA